MKFSKLTLSFLSVIISYSAIAATPVAVVASQANINLFLNGSGVAIPAASYTTGTHPIYGNVQFLRSGSPGYTTGTTTVQQRLQGTLFMTSKTLDSVSFTIGGVLHQRVSENGFLGQCVGLAKAMTNAGSTPGWRRGDAMTTTFPNGYTVVGATDILLPPGTMIAHFGGQTLYSANTTNPHVAIVLSTVVNANGTVAGFNVLDQNGLTSATINGVNTTVTSGGGGTITKHFLPWSSTSTNPVLSSKNYHVVTQCPAGQTCP
jgi:hypothetical protein